jgi:hypothetical protein
MREHGALHHLICRRWVRRAPFIKFHGVLQSIQIRISLDSHPPFLFEHGGRPPRGLAHRGAYGKFFSHVHLSFSSPTGVAGV